MRKQRQGSEHKLGNDVNRYKAKRSTEDREHRGYRMRTSGSGTDSGSASIAGRFEEDKSSKSVIKVMEDGVKA
jgi:hypothetical protein